MSFSPPTDYIDAVLQPESLSLCVCECGSRKSLSQLVADSGVSETSSRELLDEGPSLLTSLSSPLSPHHSHLTAHPGLGFCSNIHDYIVKVRLQTPSLSLSLLLMTHVHNMFFLWHTMHWVTNNVVFHASNEINRQKKFSFSPYPFSLSLSLSLSLSHVSGSLYGDVGKW